jgi:1-acyl-sn-glycerol-3-phosphate acyltransferase
VDFGIRDRKQPDGDQRTAHLVRRQLNRLIVAGILLIALVHVTVGDRLRKGSGHRAARIWVNIGARLTGLHFETCGAGGSKPVGLQLLVANHSSPLDIAAVLATHPSARFVAGADLFKIPLLGAAMRALGTVPVDRRSGSGRLTVADPQEPGVLAVFPEGAIAPLGQRLPFHRGAFALAIEARADVVPVAIHHSAARLPPKGALAVRPGTVVVEYLPSISTLSLVLEDRYRLSDQVERAIVSALDSSDGGGRQVLP